MNRLISSAALAALMTACTPADAPVASTSADGPVLSYTDAFIMAPIGGRDMTMGGVTLSVEGGDVRLVSASSPAIGTIELHTVAMNEGKMQMRRVDGFDLTDGGELKLERGGNHMMMFDVGDDLVGGEKVDITLNFESAGAPMTLIIEADVRTVGE